jgi:co-chaperonin GroES (HSP10)
MQYIPLNDYVIVKKLAGQTTTSSGIILQTTQGADTCLVVAVPDKAESLEVNDTLLIRWANAIKVDGDIYTVQVKDIICKLVKTH